MAWFRCSIISLMGFVLIRRPRTRRFSIGHEGVGRGCSFPDHRDSCSSDISGRFSTGTAGTWWFGFALLGWAYYLLGIDATRRWTLLAYYDQYSSSKLSPSGYSASMCPLMNIASQTRTPRRSSGSWARFL